MLLHLSSWLQHLQRSLLLLVTSVSHLPVCTMFCCFRRNVEAFCHKQDSVMHGVLTSVSRDKQTPPLSARDNRRNVDDTRRSSSDRCLSQIFVKNRNFCASLCHNVWCGYLMVKKTEFTYLTDRHCTATYKPRLCIASRGKSDQL